MSSNPLDLDFGSTSASNNPLVLEAPEPPVKVEIQRPEKVGGIVMVDAQAQQKHAETAEKFLDELLDASLQSPEFATMLAQLTKLGEGTIEIFNYSLMSAFSLPIIRKIGILPINNMC